MKLLAKIIGVLLLVLIAAVIYIGMNLGALIKQGIEEYAPPIVDTTVTVDSVGLMLLTGTGSINDFNVGQPKGFGDGNALALGEVSISVEPMSLTTDTVVIDEVLIDSPVINFIQLKNDSTNFTKLLDNVNKNIAQSTAQQPAPAEQPAEPAAAGGEKKIIIKEFTLSNAQLSAQIPLLGEKPLALTLPTIKLTGIGEKSGGQHAADIAKEIGEKLTAAITDAIAKSDEFKKQLTDKLKNEAKAKAEEELNKKLEEKLGEKDSQLLKGLFNR